MIGRSRTKLRAFARGMNVAWSDQSARWKIIVSIPLFTLTLAFSRYLDAGLVGLATAMVVALELLNTSIERLADVVEPEHDERIAAVKDVAAAGAHGPVQDRTTFGSMCSGNGDLRMARDMHYREAGGSMTGLDGESPPFERVASDVLSDAVALGRVARGERSREVLWTDVEQELRAEWSRCTRGSGVSWRWVSLSVRRGWDHRRA